MFFFFFVTVYRIIVLVVHRVFEFRRLHFSTTHISFFIKFFPPLFRKVCRIKKKQQIGTHVRVKSRHFFLLKTVG